MNNITDGSEKLTLQRVMVVDDNEDAVETLVELLSAYGYAAKGLCDAVATLETAQDFRPDVLLIDIGMPGADGYELARTLRRMPETASARLIAVTGHAEESYRRLAEEAGFDDYLVKPINIEELLSLLGGAGAGAAS